MKEKNNQSDEDANMQSFMELAKEQDIFTER